MSDYCKTQITVWLTQPILYERYGYVYIKVTEVYLGEYSKVNMNNATVMCMYIQPCNSNIVYAENCDLPLKLTPSGSFLKNI